MATVKQCRSAIEALAASLDDLDHETRRKHLPRRSLRCTVTDLDVVFSARIDESGVHDIDSTPRDGAEPDADVRVSLASDELVALANGDEDFLTAWLRGRVHVSAPVRDILRLRSLLGM
jgi:predicted lipid carrier protein YhbT